ncbi:MAG: sugar transferase [Planctomycetota bacterium]
MPALEPLRTSALLPGAARRQHRVLLVGNNERTRRRLQQLEEAQSRDVAVVGYLDLAKNAGAEAPALAQQPLPHLGCVREIAKVLCRTAVDEVLVTLPIKSCYDTIQGTVKTCEEAGVQVSIDADLFQSEITQPSTSRDSNPKIIYSCVPYSKWQLRLKRMMDIAGAVVGLTIFAIPMLLIAALIKLTSRGPVFFRQTRVGRNHRQFQILKFRTMIVDAETKVEALKHLNEVDGPVFKIKRDPRITWIGRILRKLSLDELPQFINVLVGEMSLVGPRPPIPSEVVEYEWWQRRRLSMKPGITCFWQVSGRNNIGFEEWMQLDLQYIDRWSIGLDLLLLLKTVPAVLRARGAS